VIRDEGGSRPLEFLSGGGEMGALMRAHDWTQSPLGPPAQWPDSLKMALKRIRIVRTTRMAPLSNSPRPSSARAPAPWKAASSRRWLDLIRRKYGTNHPTHTRKLSGKGHIVRTTKTE
jgi:hypothetical protein